MLKMKNCIIPGRFKILSLISYPSFHKYFIVDGTSLCGEQPNKPNSMSETMRFAEGHIFSFFFLHKTYIVVLVKPPQ